MIMPMADTPGDLGIHDLQSRIWQVGAAAQADIILSGAP
jgi:hypothetical protein